MGVGSFLQMLSRAGFIDDSRPPVHFSCNCTIFISTIDEIEMDDSTAPVIAKDRTGDLSAREQILALARAPGVVYRPNALDELGNAVTRLAGDEVRLDDIELLLLALERAECVSTAEADRLHIAHMRQRTS